jgi:two-component system response regulator NreC
MSKIRILIADDHAILREGIRALLSMSQDLEIIGEAADGADAIEQCRRFHPDVVLLDIAMPGLGGLEAALEIKKESPRTKILVLTQYDDREYIRRFLKIGVSGYILKKAVSAELAAAIRAVHRGGLVLDPNIAREAMDGAEATNSPSKGSEAYDLLTDREKEVLKLVAEGKSNKEVAETLGISVKTAMSHRERLMEKLEIHNRTDLIRFALRQGVIRVEP